MLAATVDETTDTYIAGVDGTFTTGTTYNGGAFAATQLLDGFFDGTSYASVTGMSECELYLADATLTPYAAQSHAGEYLRLLRAACRFRSRPAQAADPDRVPAAALSTRRFKLVASEDMSTNPIGDWIFYDFGTATGYVANSWMARNATYNAAGKYMDFKAWKNGTYREGVGGFWNLPAASALSMAWEVGLRQ